jgi:hypothetical protein
MMQIQQSMLAIVDDIGRQRDSRHRPCGADGWREISGNKRSCTGNPLGLAHA